VLASAVPLLNVEASLAHGVSVEERACIISAVAKLPQAAALRIERGRAYPLQQGLVVNHEMDGEAYGGGGECGQENPALPIIEPAGQKMRAINRKAPNISCSVACL